MGPADGVGGQDDLEAPVDGQVAVAPLSAVGVLPLVALLLAVGELLLAAAAVPLLAVDGPSLSVSLSVRNTFLHQRLRRLRAVLRYCPCPNTWLVYFITALHRVIHSVIFSFWLCSFIHLFIHKFIHSFI